MAEFGTSRQLTGRRRRRSRSLSRRVPSSKKRRTSSMARVARLLGTEQKYLDSFASLVAIPAPTDCSGGEMQPEGGCTDCLSAPAQGDGPQARDGKKIVINNVFVTGFIDYTVENDRDDVITAPTVFVALVQDKHTNKATIVSEQVFTNPNDVASVNAWPLRNMENTSRYKVLKHVTITSPAVTSGTDGASTLSNDTNGVPFMLSWKGEIPVNFTTAGTAANVNTVIDNSLHIIAFATSTTANSLAPSLSYNCRIRFVG